MDNQASSDFLSDLPLSIIHTILERVPVKAAVRTSILSRQWRYKWATQPHLSFSQDSVSYSATELKDLITQLLLLHQGPILKFELYIDYKTISHNLNSWLTFLSRNGIRELILNHYNGFSSILSSVYSCQNLTHLELFIGEIPPPPPTFKGFLCLRRLKLSFVGVSYKTIQGLLSNLDFLEELKLDECGSELDLRIHVPNLKIIHLVGVLKDICLYAPLLRVMYINFTKHVAPKTSSVCNYTELLGGLSTLEELKGGLYFFEFLSIGIESCRTPLMFPRLRFMELCPETFYDKKIESVLALICKGAPNLHKIGVSYTFSFRSSSTSLDLDSDCPFNFTFEQLKVIEFGFPYSSGNVGGRNRWMKLIKCLLARSPALEKLICVQPYMRDCELLEQTSTLLAYPRASPNAKIVFKSR